MAASFFPFLTLRSKERYFWLIEPLRSGLLESKSFYVDKLSVLCLLRLLLTTDDRSDFGKLRSSKAAGSRKKQKFWTNCWIIRRSRLEKQKHILIGTLCLFNLKGPTRNKTEANQHRPLFFGTWSLQGLFAFSFDRTQAI